MDRRRRGQVPRAPRGQLVVAVTRYLASRSPHRFVVGSDTPWRGRNRSLGSRVSAVEGGELSGASFVVGRSVEDVDLGSEVRVDMVCAEKRDDVSAGELRDLGAAFRSHRLLVLVA